MITREQTHELVASWLAAWGAGDPDRLLALCDDEIVLLSPLAAYAMDGTRGTLRGKEQVGDYFRRAMANNPKLTVNTTRVFTGVNSLVLDYEFDSMAPMSAYLELNDKGLIAKMVTHIAH